MQRKQRQHRGFTLVEVLLATAIMAMVVVAAGASLDAILRSYGAGMDYTDMVVEGRLAMASITSDLQAADSVSVVGNSLIIVYREPYDDGIAEHYYFADSAFPKPDDSAQITVTYMLSGDDIVQTKVVGAGTPVQTTMASGVSAFTPVYTAPGAQSQSRVDITLTMIDANGTEWPFERSLYLTNLESKGGAKLR